MNINEAYITGLNHSEEITIKIMTQLINNQPLDIYNNPQLETLKNILKMQLDYVNKLANNKKSNVGKHALEELKKSRELVEYRN
jgi:hypothetical protein